jgi:hypothetical protein
MMSSTSDNDVQKGGLMKRQSKSPQRITIILDPQQRRQLDGIAAEEQVSVAAIARKAIRLFLAGRGATDSDVTLPEPVAV